MILQIKKKVSYSKKLLRWLAHSYFLMHVNEVVFKLVLELGIHISVFLERKGTGVEGFLLEVF